MNAPAHKVAFIGAVEVDLSNEPAVVDAAHEVLDFPAQRRRLEAIADRHGFEGQQREQFIAQSEMQAANIAERIANGEPQERDLSLQYQRVVDISDDHIEQEVRNDGGGVDAMFSSAFAHIPADSPHYRVK